MTRLLLLMGLVLLIAGLPANASIIVSVTGSNDCCEDVVSYASWTQTVTYSNITIAASLYSDGGTATGNAYLTTQVGTGATAATQLATAAISIANTSPQLLNLFSGLTLGPGTYYLVINPTTESLEWAGDFTSPTVVVGTGITLNSGWSYFNTVATYPPATPFTTGIDGSNKGNALLYTVSGTLGGSVPALSTGAVVGATLLLGVSGLWLLRRQREA